MNKSKKKSNMHFTPLTRIKKNRFPLWLRLSVSLAVCLALGLGYCVGSASSQTSPSRNPSYACPSGASTTYLTPRLQVGNTGYSAHVGNLQIRQQPGIQGRNIGSLAPGDTFTVLEGPACVGTYVWWKLNTGRVQGWVAEGESSSSVYWLVSDTPVQRSPTSEPSPNRPRLELIAAQDGGSSSSYRLIMSNPNNIVFVFCPANYSPTLGYLSSVEAVQCE